MNNYQPADWPGDKQWSKLGRANENISGKHHDPNNINTLSRRPAETTFTDQRGRKCRVVCEPEYSNDNKSNLQTIARLLIGKNILEAQRIYPNIRVVTRNGQSLPITKDYHPERINVEIKNNIIFRVVGFY
jgi:hypothetical protein